MIRTVLALEARESAEEGAEELRGVCVEEDYHEESEVKLTKNFYPRDTSSIIIRLNPTAKHRVPTSEWRPWDISGISSSTTT